MNHMICSEGFTQNILLYPEKTLSVDFFSTVDTELGALLQIFPPSWHLLHLHLDIHWSVLEILHLLGHKMQGTLPAIEC